jgi:ribonuclease R
MSRKGKKKQVSRPPKKGRKEGAIVLRHINDQVKDFFIKHAGEPFGYMNVIKGLRVRDHKSKVAVKNALFAFEANGFLRKLSNNKYILDSELDEVQGRVDHVNPRFGYIEVQGREDDIYVKTDDLNFAVDGDLVAVEITREASTGFRAEGRVSKIIERGRTEFVGRVEVSPKFAFVVPDNRNIHFDVFVYPEKLGKAIHNDKVVVKINKWHDRSNKSPLGEVVEVLGQAGENEAEIHSIMAEFGLPFRFPNTIEKEAQKIPTTFSKADIATRRDFRKVTTFTIDPADAKDFDDALSIKELGKGKWEIGIHIADVSHYVKEGTELDKEAIERATSVYLVDRTIPMLPEVLSNGLCSLRPNEEKMTFSAVFEMDAEANVTSKWFGRTIIESDRRFAYEEAQERIESGEGDFAEEICTLNELALKLKKKRFDNGAINFETTEVRFRLDEKGKPLEVVTKVRKDAHKLIEEFMLLANKEVATFIFNQKTGKSGDPKTFVYRTHDNPNPEKLETFQGFAKRFGHDVNVTGNISRGLNALMEKIEGKPEQNILESLAIRSMAKAKYTTDPVGHFGLAFDHYTHFTSPIRRYPDVMVHRLLQHYLDGGKSVDEETYEKLCIHSSEREKRAADAERASIKYKQVEFMQSMLGQVFDGVVSGVTEWGVFVEITETKCEGMVRIADIEDDYYDFDAKQMAIIGKRNKRIITLGDRVRVQVMKTDIDRRTIDLRFEVAEEDGTKKKKKPSR